MTAVLARASVVPLLAEASLTAAQVSQLVLGEGAVVLATDGPMLQVRTMLDDYTGWLHEGYVHRTDGAGVDRWLATAAWSEGAVLWGRDGSMRAPHRARLEREGDRVRLPDGSAARIGSGRLRPWGEVIRDAQQTQAFAWAWREFVGAPYLWGGVTTAGVDCSGLVQTTFLARGVPLPRDAHAQARTGTEVSLDARRPDDLLFFRAHDSDRVAHVAIDAGDDVIVHSTVETGQVTREPWGPATRAASLRERLVAVRRLT